MNAVLKPKGKQGGWTPERRLAQSRKMQDQKIWLKSTGPRTVAGKAASSRNARHADYESRREQRAELNRITGYLRLQSYYLKTLSFQTRKGHLLPAAAQILLDHELNFLENELDKAEWAVRYGCTLADNIVVFPNLFRRDHYPDG